MSEWQDRARRLTAAAAELARRVRNVLNWRLVRSVGQLQILTRASYVTLLVVPLLAATWPGVRLIVNQHNKAVREAADLLRSSRGDFENAMTAVGGIAQEPAVAKVNIAQESAPGVVTKARAAADRIAEAAERYAQDYADSTISTPVLPWTLAAAFFGSLFVVLGHLSYQMGAPEAIRQKTWDEFVRDRKEDYAKTPTQAALDRAREFLRTREGGRVSASEEHEDETLLFRLYGMKPEERGPALKELPVNRLRSLIAWIDSGKSPAPKEYANEIRQMAEVLLPQMSVGEHDAMSIIERGARAEYLYLATRLPAAVLVTGFLYAMALWIVLLVVKVQATSVSVAAGWTSMRDLFLH